MHSPRRQEHAWPGRGKGSARVRAAPACARTPRSPRGRGRGRRESLRPAPGHRARDVTTRPANGRVRRGAARGALPSNEASRRPRPIHKKAAGSAPPLGRPALSLTPRPLRPGGQGARGWVAGGPGTSRRGLPGPGLQGGWGSPALSGVRRPRVAEPGPRRRFRGMEIPGIEGPHWAPPPEDDGALG